MADIPGRGIVPSHLAEHEGDSDANRKGYIRGTDFSLPYISTWSRLHDKEVKDGFLRNVNCSWLSTRGVPPTLLALKQHAQSLCVLIQTLNPTLEAGEIITGDPLERVSSGKGKEKETSVSSGDTVELKYHLNDAFDFLTNLNVPYTNDDPNHHIPLYGLMNEVRKRNEAYRTEYYCPFHSSKPAREAEEETKPYANHHALAMHANACLERLDHEFSATGGLLSMLPTSDEHDTEELESARNSLLGQWLLFTQHLVGRMHELERSYGNALDALAGEAALARQHLSLLGPDGRSGREIAYPQDRWVLVNAGDDVFEQVHRELDRPEAVAQAVEKTWRRNGVSGDQAWVKDTPGGKEYARGVVAVDIMTRYYRLAGQGKNTIFVVPAWDHHPGTAYTKELEGQPTVVGSVQPKYPPRASELEKRYDHRLREARRIESENMRLQEEMQRTQAMNRTLSAQQQQLAATRDALMVAVDSSGRELAVERNHWKTKYQTVEQQRSVLTAEVGEVNGKLKAMERELDAKTREVAELKARFGVV
ncbi:hypothetical protein B0T17DRAFT_615375 [Bombardia bombarda]|uniref:Uncharacterized protein n=1 Tax=Bombardia bombarda TaxID=252184 RepID=A0AA39X9F5_9PEZI|nr:hypothetical protein B0T17DRAFT_615375 [Bombardia bombarda]